MILIDHLYDPVSDVIMKVSKKISREIERKQLFDRLVKGNASCLEMVLNGFWRIYEEGETKCECITCQPLPSGNINIHK